MEEKTNIRRIISLSALLAVLILTFFSVGVGKNPPAADTELASLVYAAEPDINAEAYLVRFIGESEAVLGRRASKPIPPASLTKIMTALVASQFLEPTERVLISGSALKQAEWPVTGAGAGEEFSRDELLGVMLASSANDAAGALAEAVGRKLGKAGFEARMRAFVDLMNGESRRLGMSRSHFENPTGFDAAGHYASAEDLARLAEGTLHSAAHIWEMTRKQRGTLVSAGGNDYPFRSTNELLDEFPALIGGKTGFSDEAKGALILLYPVRIGKTAIIVILKSEDRFGDGRKIIRWLGQNFP